MRKLANGSTPEAKIVVVGVGGGGGNAVNRMIENNFVGVDYVAINTDMQDLRKSKANFRIQIGEKLTAGLGAGANPEVGQKAAEESRNLIGEYIKEANLVILTAGMGKGTGTGASPVVASIAKEMKKLVVAVITTPFYLEGKHRKSNADIGIENLAKVADAYIVVKNEKLVSPDDNATVSDAFSYADGVLRQCIQGISDVIINTQTLNIDFADLCTVLRNMGRTYLGIGSGSGPDRVLDAVKEAVGIKLQDIKIDDATSVLLYVKARRDVIMKEVDNAAVIVKEVVHPDANIIFGFDFRDDLPHEVEVMIVATGFENKGLTKDISASVKQQPIVHGNIPAPAATVSVNQGYAPQPQGFGQNYNTGVSQQPRQPASVRSDIAPSRVSMSDIEDDEDVPAWVLEQRKRAGKQ